MNPVAVRTKRYALGFCFFDGLGYVVPDRSKFVYRPLVLADYVMEVDNGWVAEPAVGTFLLGFVSLPLFAFSFFAALTFFDLCCAVLQVPSVGICFLSYAGKFLVL